MCALIRAEVAVPGRASPQNRSGVNATACESRSLPPPELAPARLALSALVKCSMLPASCAIIASYRDPRRRCFSFSAPPGGETDGSLSPAAAAPLPACTRMVAYGAAALDATLALVAPWLSAVAPRRPAAVTAVAVTLPSEWLDGLAAGIECEKTSGCSGRTTPAAVSAAAAAAI